MGDFLAEFIGDFGGTDGGASDSWEKLTLFEDVNGLSLDIDIGANLAI